MSDDRNLHPGGSKSNNSSSKRYPFVKQRLVEGFGPDIEVVFVESEDEVAAKEKRNSNGDYITIVVVCKEPYINGVLSKEARQALIRKVEKIRNEIRRRMIIAFGENDFVLLHEDPDAEAKLRKLIACRKAERDETECKRNAIPSNLSESGSHKGKNANADYKVVEPTLIPYRKGGKWGYVDTRKNLVIDAIFDEAYRFCEGLARVKIDGKWGFIDQKGNFAIKPRYDYAGFFLGGISPVVLHGECSPVDKSGRYVIVPWYDCVIRFSWALQ